MDEYLAFAKDLARQGGKLIKDNFESGLDIELKADHSPVTQVDKQINSLVIDAVRTTFPEHGILGEEASFGSGSEEYQWLCDPLDGTAAFIVGMQHSTFILGLTKAGRLLLSVVYDPFTDRLYHAVKGQGAFCNDQPIHVSNQLLKDGYVLYDNSSIYLYEQLTAVGAILEPVAGAGYRAMLLASGRCSAIVQGKADNHDVGPSSLIVEEAGGTVTLFDGTVPRYDQPIIGGLILTNGSCYDELLSVVAQAG
jgi:fructose-1,6-bisphosphatase/inositol monophosphatase family enzyme